jgi:hypothetical protein
VQAGLVLANPDKPDRPTNSPAYCYQVEPNALALIQKFGTPRWDPGLRSYLASVQTLSKCYEQARKMSRIPLKLASGATISLSPGGQNELVRRIIDDFCPRFTPGATPVYVGDTDAKWAHFDEECLASLGVRVDSHGKIPDVVVHCADRDWFVLIEAVTSHGPVKPKRLHELKKLFAGSRAGLVFVTAFMDRSGLLRHLADIAWETEVWVAESPDHMIHLNGERFLGPH